VTRFKNPRMQYIFELVTYNNETKLGFFFVAAIAIVAIGVALTGDVLLPYDPIKQNVGPALSAPSLQHLFGTDILGRDVFSRMLIATPNDVFVSFVVVGGTRTSYLRFRRWCLPYQLQSFWALASFT